MNNPNPEEDSDEELTLTLRTSATWDTSGVDKLLQAGK